MIISLDETKRFLRVDSDTDNSLIELEIAAAEEYLKNATDKTFDDSNSLAKVFCFMLVQNMYDNRTFTVSINEKISMAAGGIILQLNYCYEETEETT